jgi:hypothetical protein
MKDRDIVIEGRDRGLRHLGIGHLGLTRLGSSRVQMLPVKDSRDHEAESDGSEDKATELTFPKRIEAMNVHGG